VILPPVIIGFLSGFVLTKNEKGKEGTMGGEGEKEALEEEKRVDQSE
jgi:hypothetical protein